MMDGRNPMMDGENPMREEGKILLCAINAKYIHSNPAVYSLKASAGAAKSSVEITEFTINNQKDFILEEIYKRQPAVLCFSVYIWNLNYVESIAREFHKLCPDVPIWVGGPEVSYEVKPFLDSHPYITGVMIGEGEATFREVAEFYLRETGRAAIGEETSDETGKPEKTEKPEETEPPEEIESDETEKTGLSEIPGLAFRKKGEVTFTASRMPLSLSSLPFVYDLDGDFTNRIIYYESSRGCPFSCSYCLSSVEKSLRFRDLDLVKKELQFFIDRQVPQVKFVDRTFNCNHRHAMEIWRYIKEHDNGITNFHFEIAADLINEEELDLISDMRPGLIQLEIGVQSTNDATIEEIHRTMKLELVKKVVGRIQKGDNIHQHLDLIAGLPYEGYDSFRKSFDEIYALKPNQLQLGFLKVLKGSYMFEHRADYGLVYHDEPPYEVMKTDWLSYGEVLKIKKVEEMLEVYYNSGQFEVTMKVIEPFFGSAFDFFQKLGDFYEKKGYLEMSHSRIRRCEILLEFLTEENIGPELFQEALLFDLYYRENCKSRPSWAPDPGSFKQMTHAYCKNGKMSHIEPFHYIFPEKQEITLQKVPKRQEEAVWVLFHYDRRDPLDHQASTEQVKGLPGA